MKLGTLIDGSRDGRLVVVSRDLRRAAAVHAVVDTLQDALDDWARAAPALRELAAALEAGGCSDAFELDPRQLAAPLPRRRSGSTVRRSTATAT